MDFKEKIQKMAKKQSKKNCDRCRKIYLRASRSNKICPKCASKVQIGKKPKNFPSRYSVQYYVNEAKREMWKNSTSHS